MMKSSSLIRFTLLVFCYLLLSTGADAQISFVQISDPHLFDDTSSTTDNRWNNKVTFISCIDKINEQVLQHNAQYSFVVITGDLGLEPLVANADQKQIESNLRNGAADLASVLVRSKVHRWLFVPGNNDLLNEEPQNIRYYHLFIDALKEETKKIVPDFEIKDLCPRSDAGSDGYQSRSDLLKIDKYTFIGFDDSSFKNSEKNAGDTSKKRIELNAGLQEKYAQLVKGQLTHNDIVYAYIFYHIPAIDDPYLITKKPEDDSLKARYAAKDQIGGSFFHSAWFVNSKVRIAWNSIVIDPKVRGLFAGHFHDYRRQIYQSLSWLTPDYLPEEVEKLHVCPPLSLRLQNDKEEQARGFQEVYLDEGGKVSARLVWFNQSTWSPSLVQKAAEDAAIKQIELGRTFERLNQVKEAEGAYAKAAESDWPPTRKAALDALASLVNTEQSRSNKYFWSPLTASTTALWTAGISALPLLALALLLYYPAKRAGRYRGRHQVKIGPVVDVKNGTTGIRFDQMAALVLKRIHTHFRPRGMIRSEVRLPMLVTSQSPEIQEMIAATVPDNVGKLLGWLRKLLNKPRYSIEGMVDSNFFRRWMFISLDDRGETVEKWNMECFMNDLTAERALAFKALKRLIRNMNR